MAIRNAAKAIIINDNKILLNKYISHSGTDYYELPGGGQNQYETMEEAVIRECLEETGYQVRVVRFAALAEEIYDDPELRNNYPDYVHRIHHIFIVELCSNKMEIRSELDINQVDSIWMDTNKLHSIFIRPRQLKDHIVEILITQNPVYLGTIHENTVY